MSLNVSAVSSSLPLDLSLKPANCLAIHQQTTFSLPLDLSLKTGAKSKSRHLSVSSTDQRGDIKDMEVMSKTVTFAQESSSRKEQSLPYQRPHKMSWCVKRKMREMHKAQKRRLQFLGSDDNDQDTFSPPTKRFSPDPYGSACSSSDMEDEDRNTPSDLSNEQEQYLPKDPRDWSKTDVQLWLKYMQRVYSLDDVTLDRFPMNGKALCLMNRDMFDYRVPVGGRWLYLDFRTRLFHALNEPCRPVASRA